MQLNVNYLPTLILTNVQMTKETCQQNGAFVWNRYMSETLKQPKAKSPKIQNPTKSRTKSN